jgi:hypothetical protein
MKARIHKSRTWPASVNYPWVAYVPSFGSTMHHTWAGAVRYVNEVMRGDLSYYRNRVNP